MATNTLQPGDAPANTITHKQAAQYLVDYTANSARPFGAPDIRNAVPWMLCDLEGLLSLLSVAFDDAATHGDNSQLAHLNQQFISSAMRSAARLAALANFMAEAQ